MKRQILAVSVLAVALAACAKPKEQPQEPSQPEQTQLSASAAQLEQASTATAANDTPQTGPDSEPEMQKAAKAFTQYVCSSDKFIAEVEGNMVKLEKLASTDREAGKAYITTMNKRYRQVAEKEITARGASYEAFRFYSRGVMRDMITQQKAQDFGTLVSENCPGKEPAKIGNVLMAVFIGNVDLAPNGKPL